MEGTDVCWMHFDTLLEAVPKEERSRNRGKRCYSLKRGRERLL